MRQRAGPIALAESERDVRAVTVRNAPSALMHTGREGWLAMSDGGTLPGANNQRARGPAPANGPAPRYAVALVFFEGRFISGAELEA